MLSLWTRVETTSALGGQLVWNNGSAYTPDRLITASAPLPSLLHPPISEVNGTWRMQPSPRDRQLRVHQPLLTSVHMKKKNVCVCVCAPHWVKRCPVWERRWELPSVLLVFSFARAWVCAASTCWHLCSPGTLCFVQIFNWCPISCWRFLTAQ